MTIAVDLEVVEAERAVSMMLDAGPRLRVRVSDDGPGIHPTVIGRVFEPFFTTKKTGTGLGLAIVYGGVRDWGGAIVVESPPGQGATFTLFLKSAPRTPGL